MRTSCNDDLAAIQGFRSNIASMLQIAECALDAAEDSTHSCARILHVVLLSFAISLLFECGFEPQNFVELA